MVSITLVLSLAFSLPSSIIVALKPTFKYFKLSLFNVSLAFFFFSYHVHEKSILYPMVILNLCAKYFGDLCFDFNFFGTIVLMQLMIEDQLLLEYICLLAIFLIFGWQYNGLISKSNILAEQSMEKYYQQNLLGNYFDTLLYKLVKVSLYIYRSFIRKAFFAALIISHICQYFIKPPEKLPYTYNLCYATIGFGIFFSIFVISNLIMIQQYRFSNQKAKIQQNKIF